MSNNELDYQELIKKSFAFIWKYKFTWFFGFFLTASTGGFSGTNFGNFGSGSDVDNTRGINKGFADNVGKLFQWIESHILLILLIMLGLFLLYFIFVILSIISEGALIGAAKEGYNEDKKPTFSESFHLGSKYFWRIFGVYWAVHIPLFFTFIALLTPIILVIINFKVISMAISISVIIFFVLLIIALLIITIPIGIVLAYARRYIVIEDEHAIKAIKKGYHFLKVNVSSSLTIWAINFGVSIVAGIAIAILVVVSMLLIVPLILVAGVSEGVLNPGVILGIVSLFIVFLLLINCMAGILAAYSSTVWSFGYLRIKELTTTETEVSTETI